MRSRPRLGVSQQTISGDLKYLRGLWEREHPQAIEQGKVRELAAIDKLELTAWEGWDRSRQDAVTLHVETTTGRTDKKGKPLSDLEKKTKTVKGQAGDPRFLERVGWCIHERCSILHLITNKLDLTSGDEPIRVVAIEAVMPAAEAATNEATG